MKSAPPAQLQLNRRTVVSNIATLFSGSAVAQGMTALALLLTARQLGVDPYGQYAACLALASFAAILFNLGADIWLLREGGQRMERLGELVGSVLAIKVTLGLPWLALISIIAPLVRPNTFPVDLIFWSALAVWLDGLFATLLTNYKASLRNKFTSIIESSSDIAWFLGTLALISLDEQRVVPFVQVRVVVLLASVGVALWLVWRSGPLLPTWQTIRRILNEAFPYAASEFLAWTAMRVDVLIVALTIGERATGLYSPAVGVANALFLIPAAVYVVIVPVLSNLFTTNVEQAWITARRMIWLLLLIGSGLSVALYLAAGPLISLLGTSFGGSKEILQTLSVILFIHSLSFAMAAILVAGKQQGKRTVVQAVAVVFNAVLNLMVVYWAGIRGVAVVYVLTEVVLLGGYAWLVYRYRAHTRATQ